MKILITGASGNVGRHLTEGLGADYTVISVSRNGAEDTLGAHSYAADFADANAVQAIFKKERPDAVIHLAAILGAACEADPALAQKVNVDATKQLAELAVEYGVTQFVFFSTSAVYSQRELKPTDEVNNIDPHNTYGRTKLEAEAAIDAIAQKGTTKFVSLRPFNIYGPDFTRSLVYMLIHSSPENPVTLASFDTLYRDYVHVSDVVAATKLILGHTFDDPHSIFNVGSGVATNNAQLIKAVESAGVKPTYTRGNKDELDITWADIGRLKELGFVPTTTIIVDR